MGDFVAACNSAVAATENFAKAWIELTKLLSPDELRRLESLQGVKVTAEDRMLLTPADHAFLRSCNIRWGRELV